MKFTKAERDLFRKMGIQGGRQRAKNMTAKQRSNACRKASNARWDKIKLAAAS